jgi:hypothetical protein
VTFTYIVSVRILAQRLSFCVSPAASPFPLFPLRLPFP